MISSKDLQEIVDRASSGYTKLPARVILEGTEKELSPGEVIALSYYEAVLTVLNQKGCVTDAESLGVKLRRSK